MEALLGVSAPDRAITGSWARPCAIALAVALALGLAGCGGGGGGNVRPTPPPPAGGAGFTGGEIDVDANSVTVLPDNYSGSINLIKGGAGTLTLTGTNTFTGGTTINLGTLQIGNGGTTGSITGSVVDNASLVFDRSDNVTFGGVVSGTGSLRQAGAGTLILTGANIYSGGTTISSGMLQIGDGGTIGSIRGNVGDNGTLAFDHADDVIFTGAVTGSGGLTKAGNGSLYLSGNNGYTGVTQIVAGTLYVDGDQSAATGATNVSSGATLGGTGTLGGDVNVANGATLTPALGDIGTLTINGSLNLSAGSILDYNFRPTGPLGTQLSALINVKGNLTLDGTLNVNVEQGGDLGPGVHRLINYGGTLVDNGLTLGSMPSEGWMVQTGVAQQVNLVNTHGMVFSFWDGDAGPKGNNSIDGGSGTWTNGGSNSNWTDASGAVNASFSDSSFAVFQGSPGTVTVSDSSGAVNVAGMQFVNSGYAMQGDAINLVGSASSPSQSVIRVGDGTSFGARYTATVSNVLEGNSALVKSDFGTLILGGSNTYNGGTIISGGTLQVGNGGLTGSIAGDVTDNGVLSFNRSDDVTIVNNVSGSGSLVQAGTGKMMLTGTNTYTGGTTVAGGILEVVPGTMLGTGDIAVGHNQDEDGSSATLKVDHGAALTNHIVMRGNGILDNVDVLGGNVDIGVEGNSSYFSASSVVLNHDGGSISGNDTGVMLAGYGGTVQNSAGGLIDGGNVGVELDGGGKVTNDGSGSAIRSTGGIAVQASIYASTVQNTGGATISGGVGAINMTSGGNITNDGAGSSISSSSGNAIQVMGEAAFVQNSGGAMITGDATALYLQHGGTVINGVGSTIATTGTTSGDCGVVGNCAIFVASNGNTTQSIGGALTLNNSGTIIGNVQLIPTSFSTVTLNPSSSIHGNLDIGSGFLNLAGTSGTVQLYSQAVTGTTTFVGALSAPSSGTWIIDNNDINADGTSIGGGTLQIGNGGTQGSIGNGNVALYFGQLVFDRSDDVTFGGSISSQHSEAYDGTLVQAGTGVLTLLMTNDISPTHIIVKSGTLQIDNTGNLPTCLCSNYLMSDIENDASIVFNSNWSIYSSSISGTGSVTQNGSGQTILSGQSTYTGGTTVNRGSLFAGGVLPGNATVNANGLLGGFTGVSPFPGLPGVAGNLSNAGVVSVRLGDSTIGGNYTQASTSTLAVSLGSKLAVTGTATLNGGTLEVTGADSGYVSNTHTDVLTAAGGLTGTFSQLVKDSGVVFTATTINYDANSVWLDTTGLNITNAITAQGGSFTPASFGSAQRVQGAFDQLDTKIAAGDVSSVSTDFVKAAGQIQQAPTVQVAQASLQSLSGQLLAASAAMTFEAIDASSRALADRFDDLLGKKTGYGMWTHSLNVGGDMGRAGYDGVGFQLNGWLVGDDRQIGNSGVAGFAFGQSQGQQQLDQSYDHNRSRGTEGMAYAGWLNGNWYTQGRIGFGHFQQDVNRQLLLGTTAQGVTTDYSGNYNVAYGESGLHLNWAGSRIMPFVNVEYASIDRDGFAEQGAGGFGLRTNAQTLDRWQAGVGMRANHHWDLGGGRALDFNASAQFQRTLASQGDVFDASFVGLQQWQPLLGIGLSRYSGVFNVGLDATLTPRTSLKFGYDYERGQRDQAQMLSAHLIMAF